MSNKRQDELSEMLDGLNQIDLMQLSSLIQFRIEDKTVERQRLAAVDVMRGEFEELAGRITRIEQGLAVNWGEGKFYGESGGLNIDGSPSKPEAKP